jgi:hypothetical protein
VRCPVAEHVRPRSVNPCRARLLHLQDHGRSITPPICPLSHLMRQACPFHQREIPRRPLSARRPPGASWPPQSVEGMPGSSRKSSIRAARAHSPPCSSCAVGLREGMDDLRRQHRHPDAALLRSCISRGNPAICCMPSFSRLPGGWMLLASVDKLGDKALQKLHAFRLAAGLGRGIWILQSVC